MKTLQNLLKEYIKQNNLTIYSLAARSNINRTTLQKVLSGDRSLSKENFEKLIPFFHLTPLQREELEASFLIEQIGESNYSCYMEVKTLLECIAIPQFAQTACTQLSSAINPVSGTVFTGRHQILTHIAHMICSCYEENCSQELCIYGSFDMDIWNDLYILLYQINHNGFSELQITHIVPLLKSNSTNIPYNIHVLGNILPYTFSDIRNLHIYCYYEFCIANEYASPYPYYVLFHDSVFLISKNFENALFLCLPLENKYSHGFEELKRNSFPIISYSIGYSEAINQIIQSENPDSFYFFGNFPPLGIGTQFQESVYVVSGSPDHTKKKYGLSRFQITTLQHALMNSNNRSSYKIVKEGYFYPNRNLTFCTTGNTDIHFLYRLDTDKCRCCSLTEASIAKTMADFSSHLEVLNLAYSADETKHLLLRSII